MIEISFGENNYAFSEIFSKYPVLEELILITTIL
jgi:hypothetical protein